MTRVATVVPFVRLPRGIDFFDYAIPDALAALVEPGSRVVIPFRKKMIDGIVWDVRGAEGEPRSLKEIVEILSLPPLPARLRALADWATGYYACSRSLILPLVAGPRLKRVAAGSNDTPSRGGGQERMHMAGGVSIRRFTDYAWRDAFIKKTAREHVKKREQLMILCPTVKRVSEVVALLGGADGNLCEFTSGLPKGKEVALRNALRRGDMTIAVGTRVLAFVDMPRLSTILVDKAHRDEHAQYDMNPRYDARTIAYRRRESEGVSLILISPTPRMEDWHEALSGRAQKAEHSAPCPPCTLVSIGDIWRSGQKGFISEALERDTARALEEDKDAFYLVNKKGYASQMICAECEWIFSCQTCSSPLPGTNRESAVICRMCASPAAVPTRCPSCGNVRFLLPGMGIEKIAEQVRALFPGIPLVQISSETIGSPEATSYLSGSAQAGRTIVIATSLMPEEQGQIFSRFGAIGVIAADAVSLQFNFRAYEQQWRMLRAVSMLAQKNESRLVIQAFTPESDFIADVVSDNFARFARRELEERRKFRWPPFGRCVVLFPHSGGTKNPSLSVNLESLKNSSRKAGATMTLIARGRRDERIVLRFPSYATAELPPECSALFASLPPQWLVDTDPISL